MTTIAYDGTMLAADRQEMIGQSERMPHEVTKILRCTIPGHLGTLPPPPPEATPVDRYYWPRQRVLVAFSGSLLFARKLLLHYVEAPRVLGHPITSPSADGESGSLIVVHLDGERPTAVLVCCSGGVSNITGKPMACGSGGDYAMGAMYAGQSAHRAVETAAQLDAFTGDRIDSISILAALVDPIGMFPFYLD